MAIRFAGVVAVPISGTTTTFSVPNRGTKSKIDKYLADMRYLAGRESAVRKWGTFITSRPGDL
jgi:hypothetical protein